jgi:glycerol uptake facilitator-like aquaporin
MLRDYIAEGAGSFVFFAIVFTQKNPILIAVGLLIGILIASIASQSHLNPAISTVSYIKGEMSGEVAVGYIISQLIGAYAAYQFSILVKNKDPIQPLNN